MARKYKHFIIDSGPEISRVTISRPGDRNSINSEVIAELGLVLSGLEATDCRAVIFTGGGDEYFIGGADGIEMMQCTPDQARDFSQRIQAVFDRMEHSPLILLAAINGLCFGGGFEFAMSCDLRVASETARIGLPETKVGIIPGGGGTQRLPRLVGMGLASEMILTGRLYKGQEALSLGLVNRCAPQDKLLASAEDLLAQALRQPRHALAHAKAALRAARHETHAQGQKAESEQFSQCFKHDYFIELMRSQLRAGTLVSTAQLPAGFLDGGPGKEK